MIRTGFFHSIKNRLIFLFSILFLIIIFLVITFFVYDSKNSGIVNYAHQLQSLKYLVVKLDAVEKELLITRSDTNRIEGKSYEKLLAGYNHTIENLSDKFITLNSDDIVQHNREIQASLTQISNEFYAHRNKADSLLRARVKKGYNTIDLKDDLQISLQKIANAIEDLNAQVNSKTSKSSNSLRALYIFILVIALILNISLIIFVVFKFGEPLKELSENIELVVKRNFARDIKIATFNSKDEISSLASNFKVMLQRVHERTDEVLRQKQEVTNTLKNIKLLSKIGKEIISHLNIEKLLRAVYAHLEKLMDADVFSIGIFNEEKKGLDLWSIFSGEDIIKEGFDEVRNETMLSIWCYTNQKEVFIQDYELEFRKYTAKIEKKASKAETMYSIIYIPLSFKDEQIGVITVQSHNKYAYSEKHLNLLSNLGVYISIALENAYAYHRIEQQQKEITEKANDLHRANEKIMSTNEALEQQKEEIIAQRDEIYQSQQEIKGSEQKFRLLVENLSELIFTLNERGEIEYLSPAFSSLHGGNPAKYARKHISELIIEEDRELVRKYLNTDSLTSKIKNAIEVRMLNSQDKLLWLNMNCRKFVDEEGSSGFQGVLSDVSERKKALQKEKEINEELSLKNTQIVEQQKHITDSIYYAKRIQQAVLPTSEFVGKYFPEHFIYFRPRDIVSGDYYWMLKKVHNVIFAVADCTGHGVPGAFMSMLGVSFLNEIVHKNLKKFYDGTVQLNDLLNQLKQKVIKSLRQTGKAGETKDGMDIGLCMINLETREMQYSGAYHPLILMRDNAIKQFKPDKMPVGYYINEKPSFTNHDFQLQPGDTLYMFSDGYIDQFGGEHGRKFMSKRFKQLLLDIHKKPMKNQYEILDGTLKNWMAKKYKQVDDIMVMGIRIQK